MIPRYRHPFGGLSEYPHAGLGPRAPKVRAGADTLCGMSRRPQRQGRARCCGGQGTRMREETEFRPKPMVEIGGRPILWHIMKLYAAHGFNDFVLCLGYRGDDDQGLLPELPRCTTRDFTVDLAQRRRVELPPPPRRGLARDARRHRARDAMTGAPRQAGRAATSTTTTSSCCTYGDGVADIDIGALVAFHRSHGRLATVTGVHPPARFGELVARRRRGRPRSPRSPRRRRAGSTAASSSSSRRVLDRLSATTRPASSSASRWRVWPRDGQLTVYAHDGFWQCADTLRDVELLRGLWDGGKAPWQVWDEEARRRRRFPGCGRHDGLRRLRRRRAPHGARSGAGRRHLPHRQLALAGGHAHRSLPARAGAGRPLPALQGPAPPASTPCWSRRGCSAATPSWTATAATAARSPGIRSAATPASRSPAAPRPRPIDRRRPGPGRPPRRQRQAHLLPGRRRRAERGLGVGGALPGRPPAPRQPHPDRGRQRLPGARHRRGGARHGPDRRPPEAFGLAVTEVDGHAHDGLERALRRRIDGPTAVVARTIKGYGVGFLEGDVMSHYRSFKPDQRETLLGALDERLRRAA